MHKSLVVLAALALVAVALVGFFIGTSDERASSATRPSSAPTAGEASEGPGLAAELPGQADSESATSGVPELARRAEAPRTELSPESLALSSGERRPIEGSVLLPVGAPADETLRVLAFDQPMSEVALHGQDGVVRALLAGEKDVEGLVAQAAVDAAGRFRLTVPAERERAWLAVDGRFLRLGAAQEVATAREDPVVLRPHLGAWIHGRITLPDGVDTAQTFGELEVDLDMDTDEFEVFGVTGPTAFGREADVDETGRFELRAVDTAHTWLLTVEHDELANHERKGIELALGETLFLEPALERGALLRGVVLAPDGAPAPGARVAALTRFVFGFAAGASSTAEADEEGRFELRGVAAGEVQLRADADGYLESELVEVEAVAGVERTGLTLELLEGAHIAGQVLLPNGEPAAGAEVRVSFDPAALMGMDAFNAGRGAEGEAETDTEGRFRVTGLGKGPFVVRAALEREEPGRLYGERDGVQPDTDALEIELEVASRLTGVVQDVTGNPVPAYTLTVARVAEEGPLGGIGGSLRRSEEIQDAAGHFAVEDLHRGTYRVSARAAGFGPPVPVETRLPEEAHLSVTLRLPPEASVTGTVRNPSGAPVSGASVTVQPDANESMAALRGEGDLPTTVSDEGGAFRLEGLGPGTSSLVAAHPDYAEGEPVTVEVPSGGLVQDVELAVRRGGSLRGVLYGRDGEPAAGTRVILQQPLSLRSRFVTTERDGGFAANRLTPGNWQVTAFLDGTRFGGGADEDDEQQMTNMLENLRFTMVEVKDGEESWVELGAPPEDPVELSGTVTAGGEPVGPGLLSFTPEGSLGFDSLVMARVRADGTYATDLKAPGRYHVQMQILDSENSMQQQTVELSTQVPEVEEHVYHVELPVGSVTGTVQDEHGVPLDGARVTLITEGALPTGTFMGGQYAESATDERGRYAFLYLRPGTYAVAAGGAIFGGAFGTQSEHGRTVHAGIRVGEGETLSGIDFRLGRAGNIRGVVRDAAGRPVPEASIFVRDEAGRLLERFSMTLSGPDGSFTYAGVAPGEYSVTARSLTEASAEGRWVRVRAGDPAKLDLVLDAGTTLLVEVVDSTGAEVDATVSVRNAEGHEMNGMLGFSQIMGRMAEGFDIAVQRIGPLPAGRYEVEVHAADGRSARKPVTLGSKSERKLKLRLR